MRKLLGSMVFLALLFTGLALLNTLSYEPQQVTGQWNGWNELEKNSVDVLFLGNSHAECSVAPLQLFEEAGIKSWVLKSSGCNMPVRYYYLKEALKTQKPRLIAVEIFTDKLGTKLNDGQNLAAYGEMPFGLNRVLCSSITSTSTVTPSFAIPLVAHHTSLWRLSRSRIMTSLFSGNNLENSTAGGFILTKPLTAEDKLKYRPGVTQFPLATQKDFDFQMTYLKKSLNWHKRMISLCLCGWPQRSLLDKSHFLLR